MINLFTTYYIDKNPVRQKEIDFCMLKNLQNKSINTVIIESQNRVKFKFMFDIVNNYTNKDDINIVCNADIWIDEENAKLLEKIKHEECYALSRWDWNDGKPIHFARSDSQDFWCFRDKIKDVESDFCLGLLGCDNRLAYCLKQAKYTITNPSLTIKSYHVHSSNIRNYTYSQEYSVPGPYERVTPITLI